MQWKVVNFVDPTFEYFLIVLNGIKVQVFFGKKLEKKHLGCHDKNYYYFLKSNIPVINFIVNSKNLIKVSKNVRL